MTRRPPTRRTSARDRHRECTARALPGRVLVAIPLLMGVIGIYKLVRYVLPPEITVIMAGVGLFLVVAYVALARSAQRAPERRRRGAPRLLDRAPRPRVEAWRG